MSDFESRIHGMALAFDGLRVRKRSKGRFKTTPGKTASDQNQAISPVAAIPTTEKRSKMMRRIDQGLAESRKGTPHDA